MKAEASSKGAAGGVDRALKKTGADGTASYEVDARAIARVLVRHYGDEAETVLDTARHFLGTARKGKR